MGNDLSKLDRLWDATRPLEPADARWDALWARVSESLDHPAPPVVTLPSRTWKRYALAAFALAQAAAILAAVVVWGSRGLPEESGSKPTTGVVKAVVPRLSVDIEPGQVVMIHLGGDGLRVMDPAEEPGFSPLDENLVLFNDAEAMAGMQDTVAEMHHDAQFLPPPG